MSIWSQAIEMAERTPEERNRYVDFLRAVSILMVVSGHWLVAAPWIQEGAFVAGDLLEMRPNTQWLTWVFQVMPIFFIVGGYANAVSLESAKRRSVGYAGWLATRLHRLVTPLLALLLGWALLALTLYFFGVEGDTTRLASRGALIPIWFLAIYIAVVMLAPLTYKAWERWGFASLFAFVAVGAIVDALFFAAEIKWPGWTQYFWVWLSVHHLGYAWRDGRLGSPARLLAWSAIGFGALWILIFEGPYPFAMVGSPDEGLSNTLPPKITLFALGVFQFGLLLAIEAPMRRLLSNVRLWAATVLMAHHGTHCGRRPVLPDRVRTQPRTRHSGMVADTASVARRTLCTPVAAYPGAVAAGATCPFARSTSAECRAPGRWRADDLPRRRLSCIIRVWQRTVALPGHHCILYGRNGIVA
jgi:peptidoglycan/LPS O-acetylase OafA/YrhL